MNKPTDFALGGKIYWRDLAMQLATVWWKVAEVGGTLQHGDLESHETCFSVVLEKHGGQCFHADTPMDAWNKAKAWLMSPDRPTTPELKEATLSVVSLTFSGQCDAILCLLQTLVDSPVKRTLNEMQQLSDRLHSIASVVSKMELTEIQP